MRSNAATVEKYIKDLGGEDGAAISRIRGMILKAAPDIAESMDHFMPFYRIGGKFLVVSFFHS
jgi:hypothetical protein